MPYRDPLAENRLGDTTPHPGSTRFSNAFRVASVRGTVLLPLLDQAAERPASAAAPHDHGSAVGCKPWLAGRSFEQDLGQFREVMSRRIRKRAVVQRHAGPGKHVSLYGFVISQCQLRLKRP